MKEKAGYALRIVKDRRFARERFILIAAAVTEKHVAQMHLSAQRAEHIGMADRHCDTGRNEETQTYRILQGDFECQPKGSVISKNVNDSISSALSSGFDQLSAQKRLAVIRL